MKARLSRLYHTGKITQEELRRAIDKGWIDEFDYAEIVGGQ